MLSPETSPLRIRGRQAFSRPKLVEHRSVGRQDLRVKGMNETVHLRRGGTSLALTTATCDKPTVAQRLQSSDEWDHRFNAPSLRHIQRTKIKTHGGCPFEDDTVLGVELIQPPQEGLDDVRR